MLKNTPLRSYLHQHKAEEGTRITLLSIRKGSGKRYVFDMERMPSHKVTAVEDDRSHTLPVFSFLQTVHLVVGSSWVKLH